jgi:hypothetical protein
MLLKELLDFHQCSSWSTILVSRANRTNP